MSTHYIADQNNYLYHLPTFNKAGRRKIGVLFVFVAGWLFLAKLIATFPPQNGVEVYGVTLQNMKATNLKNLATS